MHIHPANGAPWRGTPSPAKPDVPAPFIPLDDDPAPFDPPDEAGEPESAHADERAAPIIETTPSVSVENLTKVYDARAAVDDVSFYVPSGWTVGLLGGNGAGKTTTIAMIMGLVTPTRGRASVLGFDMARERHKALGRMNFESPYVALPARLTVRQNLLVFGRLYGTPDLNERIEELTEEFELGDILNNLTGRLSAGQKTRVSLAKALINDPEVLLLDEPTASLDPDRADWVRGSLEAHQRRRGSSILLSSHNMAEVERMCDYVIIMSRGAIVVSGSPSQLMEDYACGDLDEVFIEISRGGE
jgi:ABC-2 type transport system ATP-binding protein